MVQQDLFGGVAVAAPPVWRPDPEKVRARLERILGQAEAAEVMPWERSQLNLYCQIVPDISRWLPNLEAAAWRARFAAELERLAAR